VLTAVGKPVVFSLQFRTGLGRAFTVLLQIAMPGSLRPILRIRLLRVRPNHGARGDHGLASAGN
jgi:hypothetical protein